MKPYVFYHFLKGLGHDLNPKFSNFIRPFSMYRIINMGIVSGSSKFETQISNYKQGTEFEILSFYKQSFSGYCLHMCCIGISFNYKYCFLLFIILFIIHIESDYIVCRESFCQRK